MMMTTSQASEPSFFSALFDVSFSNFVTNRIIKVLYILALIGVTIGAGLPGHGADSGRWRRPSRAHRRAAVLPARPDLHPGPARGHHRPVPNR
jgi:hypothetical protein